MKKGFTILELLVVLVIISLTAAFVAPRILAPTKVRLKATAGKVSGALRYASTIATTEKKVIVVLFDMKNKRLSMMPLESFREMPALPDRTTDRTKDYEGLSEFNFHEDILFMEALSTIERIDADTFIIYFYPNGTSTGGDIVLSMDGGVQYKISVDFITSIIHIDRV